MINGSLFVLWVRVLVRIFLL